MKTFPRTALALSFILVILNGCSALLVRQKYEELAEMQMYKIKAWSNAISLSADYCKTIPGECRQKLIKLSAWISREDDWYRLFMPPYMKGIGFYETTLMNTAPRILPMDERFLEELKLMAHLADIGVLSEEEGRNLVTSALRNLGTNLQREAQGLTYEYQVALQSDSQIHQAILAGLATGLLVAATAPRAPASPPPIQTFTVTDFSRGRMYSCHSTPNQITCF